MAKVTDKFSYESLQDGASIVSYLQALADGFAKGSLKLSNADEELAMDPWGLLRFRLEARRGRHRSRLVLRVSWRENRPGDEPEQQPLGIQ